jgi:hypothetical protein
VTAALRRIALAFGLTLGSSGCLRGEADDAAATGDEAACDDLLVPERCFDCLEAQCCEQVRACTEDVAADGCASCIQGEADCSKSPVALELYGCVLSDCADACDPAAPGPVCDAPEARSGGSCVELGGLAACNPVTNEGCDLSAGEACDWDAGGFHCFAPPNDRGLCDACGDGEGFCAPGSSCFRSVGISSEGVAIRGRCARTCCDDGDCGSGRCARAVAAEGMEVGVCLEVEVAK